MRVLTSLFLCILLLTLPASADTWPARAVRIVVPFVAGGPADTLARVLADKLSAAWGQPVVIENRGGGGGNIGAELAARAAPDGYTLLINPSNHVINASLYAKLPFDPIADFTPLSEIASYMLVLVVHPSVPATTLKEFVAYARAQPKGLTLANASAGSPTHLTAALFAQVAGLNVVHVSYRGAAPANADLLGGQVPAMFDNPMNALPHVNASALRALAVTGEARLALLPDVPTVAEQGYPGFASGTWYGLFAPARLPPELADKISRDAIAALRSPMAPRGAPARGRD
jgi:tripartite-type tricarboxylate transporter receptor subunit TctC